MKPTRQCHIVLYKLLGETQWTIRHGWIPTEDGESLRQYFSTLPTCGEFYVVPSEPRNNTLQMFGEIRTEFENPENDDVSTSKQLEERKAVTAELLRRNKARVKQEDQERLSEGNSSDKLRQPCQFRAIQLQAQSYYESWWVARKGKAGMPALHGGWQGLQRSSVSRMQW